MYPLSTSTNWSGHSSNKYKTNSGTAKVSLHWQCWRGLQGKLSNCARTLSISTSVGPVCSEGWCHGSLSDGCLPLPVTSSTTAPDTEASASSSDDSLWYWCLWCLILWCLSLWCLTLWCLSLWCPILWWHILHRTWMAYCCQKLCFSFV